MEGIPAEYMGRIVSKDKFRAYVYAANGDEKLVNSWNEFEAHMLTGIWYTSRPEKSIVEE